MKTIKTVKMTAVIIGLFLSLGSLTSCEKVDNTDTITSNNIQETLLRTEIITVYANQWENFITCQEADLNCKIMSNGTDYEWIKVYIKVNNDNIKVNRNYEQTDIWEELTYGDMGFTVDDFKVYVQKPCDWEAESCVYMVELELKEKTSIRANSEAETNEALITE